MRLLVLVLCLSSYLYPPRLASPPLTSKLAELGERISATGRDHPIPKLPERKLKALEREAAKAAAIAEQEREAAALAEIGAAAEQAAAAGSENQQWQQQQQQHGEVGAVQPAGGHAAAQALQEPVQLKAHQQQQEQQQQPLAKDGGAGVLQPAVGACAVRPHAQVAAAVAGQGSTHSTATCESPAAKRQAV